MKRKLHEYTHKLNNWYNGLQLKYKLLILALIFIPLVVGMLYLPWMVEHSYGLCIAYVLCFSAFAYWANFRDIHHEPKKVVFTSDEVLSLNNWQKNMPVHPFTCCGPSEIAECERNKGISEGELVATETGWICPCGKYTQNWAHDFMKQKP